MTLNEVQTADSYSDDVRLVYANRLDLLFIVNILKQQTFKISFKVNIYLQNVILTISPTIQIWRKIIYSWLTYVTATLHMYVRINLLLPISKKNTQSVNY